MLLHHREKLDDGLGAGSNEDLTLARLLGVVDGIEAIVEDGSSDHLEGCKRFSMANDAIEVSVESSR